MKTATKTSVNLTADGHRVIAHGVTTFDLSLESPNFTGTGESLVDTAFRNGLTPRVLTGIRHGDTCTIEIHAAGTSIGAARFQKEAPVLTTFGRKRLPDTGTTPFELSIVATPADDAASVEYPAPARLMRDLLREVAKRTDAAKVYGETLTDGPLSAVTLDIVFLSNSLYAGNMERELRRAFDPNRVHFTIRPIGDAPPEEELTLVPEDPEPPRTPTGNGRRVHAHTGTPGSLTATTPWPVFDEAGVMYASPDIV
jgi:hypothetical protein